MADDVTIATWFLVLVTAVLVIMTGYYAKQTKNLVSREKLNLEVALLRDELENVMGPLFIFATAIRAAFHKQHPTIDLGTPLTDGFDSVVTLYLKRGYFDELILRKPHLIDEHLREHWIEEQWVRTLPFDRKLIYVSVHVNKATVAWIDSIEGKYHALKKQYEELIHRTRV